MRTLSAILFLSLSAPAWASSGEGRVVCAGVNPHVDKAELTLEVSETGAATASMTYQSLADDGEEHPPFTAAFEPRDIVEATIGFQHVSFVFAHHNTVVKLLADGDLFGGATEDDDGGAPFQGALFYRTGNGNATVSRFPVTCRKTN